MKTRIKQNITAALIVYLAVFVSGCKLPAAIQREENRTVPEYVVESKDTLNSAQQISTEFFKDPYLQQLIDSALRNNQELNILQQEMQIAAAEIRAKKGEYLPSVGLGGAAGVDKAARYTAQGASEATTDIEPGKAMPDPVPDFTVAAYATWEIDIWHKLRNAKKAAASRYLSTVEGRNFQVTNLVAEIAQTYYELLALDNQLEIVKQNVEIQSNALEIVKLQKVSAKVTELAVRKFEAEVLNTRSKQFAIQQRIVETENRLNFLVGRFPQHVARSEVSFDVLIPDTIYAGIPVQLLENRSDIRQAERELEAAKLDVKVARADFYPSLRISATGGIQAFNPAYLMRAPESILYSLVGDMVGPLLNRNALKAKYSSANAKQVQAVYAYERSILIAYIEVNNQLSNMKNLQESYNLKEKQVAALTESIAISSDLFSSARADYMEVLLTQRDALEARFELIDLRLQQFNAMIGTYRALGGGWKE